MPQTEFKRTLLKNSISSDWKGSSSNHRTHRPMRSNRTVYRAGTFVLHSLPALSALNPQTLCTFKPLNYVRSIPIRLFRKKTIFY